MDGGGLQRQQELYRAVFLVAFLLFAVSGAAMRILYKFRMQGVYDRILGVWQGAAHPWRGSLPRCPDPRMIAG